MKHAREDYNRIQDPAGLIPEDEPVFLIRGQDMNAPAALRRYAALAQESGASRDLIDKVVDHAEAMERWQEIHGFKVPDLASTTPEHRPMSGEAPIAEWSCEEKRDRCRNPFGCHCAEIEGLQVRLARALSRTSTRAETVAAQIKPLEWNSSCELNNGCWVGTGPLHWRTLPYPQGYSISHEDGFFHVSVEDGRLGVDEALGRYPSPTEAIDAAQADYEQRIRSAIVEPGPLASPPSADVVNALREALARVRDATDADNPESYRSDDREGCLDTVFSIADAALSAFPEQTEQED